MDPSNTPDDRDWRGYGSLKHLFIFGDSYSSIRFISYRLKRDLLDEIKPTIEQPLGVKYPGDTFCGFGKANWVGLLATHYVRSPLLVYDYAEGGNTADDLIRQVREEFIPYAGSKKDKYSPWTGEDSLFVTWIGVNDIALADDPKTAQRTVFELQHDLYEAGARNFLLINVPPLPRYRRVDRSIREREDLCETWNRLLPDNIETFVASHPRSTMFLFDAHRLFSEIMGHPPDYGFPPLAGLAGDGQIWVDNIHPTQEVHDIVAQRLAIFLDLGKEAAFK
ncbi:hypothetical protein FRC03_000229 [Tulasnella sp. 419]|nr:hypothetical protein FRC03_000229 [Tulasnella sp. 419]